MVMFVINPGSKLAFLFAWPPGPVFGGDSSTATMQVNSVSLSIIDQNVR